MKNHVIVTIVLTIILSIFPIQRTVYAESADMEKFKKSVETVKTSTENLKDILGDDESIKAIIDTFNSFTNVISTIGTVADSLGSVVSFLQLIGVIKGPNAVIHDINVQVHEINEKMNQMQESLNNITNQMSTIAASSEFRDRTTQAILMKGNWNTYITNYEEAMSDYINIEYKGLLTNGIQVWMEAPRESGDNKSDTNKVIVWYKQENGEYVFKNTYANSFDLDNQRSEADIPSPFVIYNDEFDVENDKLIILGDTFLPVAGKYTYNADTYRSTLVKYIENQIRNNKNDFSKFDVHNYSEEEIANLTEEQITKIAEDAVDGLVYRIIYNAINRMNSFAHGSVNTFKKFCEHLLSDQQGVDAMLKWLYLTHAFQFQIKDDINNFIDSMILKVGMYGMFLTDTVFLSRAITESERSEIINLFSDTIEKLESVKNNAIFKNYDNYSYITNTVIYLGEIEFHGSVNIDWSRRGTYASYRGVSGGSINNRITRDRVMYDIPDQYLLGDVNALVLAYTLQSNGVKFDYDFMNKHMLFSQDHPVDTKEFVVTSLNGQKTMNDNTYLKLNSYNILGGYFEGNPSFYLNGLPGKSEMEYFQIRNMITGTIFDTQSATLNIDKPLLGIGAYGEDHSYWLVDECAALSGASTVHYSSEKEDKYAGTDFIGNVFTTTTHNAHSVYNCLLSIPERRPPVGEADPLESFKTMLENIDSKQHMHEWDYGASEEADGTTIMNYKCESNNHRYSELVSDQEYVELTFELDGGTLNDYSNQYATLVKKDRTTTLPSSPVKEGYVFVSWSDYSDDAKYDAGAEYKADADTTFKAIYKPSELYYFVSGKDQKMYVNNLQNVKFHIKRSSFDYMTTLHFIGFSIDDIEMDLTKCKIEQGSLIITIDKNYIDSLNLSVGMHSIKFRFEETTIETTLEILPVSTYKLPMTGIE